MKYLNYFTLCVCALCLFSCASDIADITGSISGTVKDVSTDTGIESCHVTISPSNISKTTNSAGLFSFDGLDAGAYSLAFSKEGYESQTKELTVVAGKTTNTDILLKPIQVSQVFSVNPESLNFGDLETTKELYLSKNGGNDTQFSIKADQTWISVNPVSGTLGNTDVKITIVVNRSELSVGDFHGTITITSSFGEISVPVFMSKAENSVPQVVSAETGYDITESSFKINGTILKAGGNEITSHGHCWSKNENPTIADYKTNLGSTKEIGEFTSLVNQNITSGETYYVRAYAVNKNGAGYSSSIKVIIPKITKPIVVTETSKDITKTSAIINGSITDTGNGEITECGFYYGTTSNPTTKITNSSVTANFSYNLSSLKEGTTYYYKAYAKNSKGESCGEVLSFTTLDTAKPTVVTLASTNVTESSAVINGSITDAGDGEVTECGFYYGTTSNPTTKITNSSVASKFSYNILSLKEGTTYYYKAYAKNKKGESCGEVLSFTTSQVAKPTVVTLPSTNVTESSAVINGSITDAGDGEVTECGFYYGTTSNPTTKIANSSVANKFSYNLMSLKEGTTYYYKAYAKNSKGESCGEVLSFTTTEIIKPTVVTLPSIDITESSATIKGSITDAGTGNITECGFYYGTTSNPTTKITNSSVAANFSYNLLSLKDGTTYYYKAYAKNEKGESYGEVLSFTTTEIIKPSVVTLSSTDITESSAVINGSITDAGTGNITECGFYYGKTSNPTMKVTNSSVTTNFSYNLSSLSDGTTYYYKAYAKNSKGESYGDVLSFSTLQESSIRGVITDNTTNIGYSSATLNASVWGEFKGAKEISEYGFYFGENPYQMQKKSAKNIANNCFDLGLTSLSPETKYYYYAYIRCYDNTVFKGDILSFTTSQKPSITYYNYYANKTVDKQLWLNLTVTVDPAGLQIIDAGFIMGAPLYENDKLHSSYNKILIVPCEFHDNKVTYEGLVAKDYLLLGTDLSTYIKPYFVFEDGTEIYGKIEYMYEGKHIEK